VVVDAGVAENVKEEPVAGERAVLPAAVKVKSVAKPVVAPPLPETVIVQVAIFARRKGLAMVHAREEAAVGVPNTANVSEPGVKTTPPVESFSVIWNAVVATVGAVNQKLKMLPPLAVVRVMAPLPEGP